MRALVRFVLLPAAGLLALLVGVFLFLSLGITGERHARGQVTERAVARESVARRAARQVAARDALAVPRAPGGQILFGDLHVHTTYSGDAFVFSLPLLQGEGAHPPADACDFARFCAGLDFWSINDHAEHLTPWQWEETKRSIRECNAVAGDADDPDLVSFLGWEWTQSAPSGLPARRLHYGHKNVIFRATADGEVPPRPIGAGPGGLFAFGEVPGLALAIARALLPLGDFPGNLRPYLDFNRYARDVRALAACPEGVPVRDLPQDCIEGAATPEELFAKLDDWGFESLVIPHGTAWGIHAPADAELDAQLAPGQHDPSRQRLFEVYSGHGASETWRDLRDTTPDGSCAAPRGGYLPCCWRAGEIVRTRCGDVASDVCEERVRNARRWFLEAGPGPRAFRVVPGATSEDWRECGQLADGFLPAFDYRPRMSAQYGLAVRPEGAAPGDAGAFRYGLVASSDTHTARAGAGYKEVERLFFSDAYGFRGDWLERLGIGPGPVSPEPVPPERIPQGLLPQDPGTERNASYYYTAGLAAVHAAGRSREAIWDALVARRAYGTSGPRILLWFDLDNAPGGPQPMGSEVTLAETPRFRVRAAGAFAQHPGCPEATRARLAPERLESLCRGECYHPGDVRRAIERIEIVRIRPQTDPQEPLAGLIEDPWRTFACPGTPEGCGVSFGDPEYDGSREHLYYVRALQEPTPAVNGDPMRCTRDAGGRCTSARLCPAGGADFDPDDDCLNPVRERAWSSPIWVRPGP